MFVSVIFSVMYKFFCHIHSVILNRSNEYSSVAVHNKKLILNFKRKLITEFKTKFWNLCLKNSGRPVGGLVGWLVGLEVTLTQELQNVSLNNFNIKNKILLFDQFYVILKKCNSYTSSLQHNIPHSICLVLVLWNLFPRSRIVEPFNSYKVKCKKLFL